MFQYMMQAMNYLSPLTGETSGPSYQFEWWVTGFMTGMAICVCGAIVRAVKMSGGSKGEL